VPETAVTATILIRFSAAIDRVEAAAGGDFVFAFLLAFLRFGRCDVVFADIAFPEAGGSGRAAGSLTLTRFLPRFAPICSHHCTFSREKA
jgi:hypothetical protein